MTNQERTFLKNMIIAMNESREAGVKIAMIFEDTDGEIHIHYSGSHEWAADVGEDLTCLADSAIITAENDVDDMLDQLLDDINFN